MHIRVEKKDDLKNIRTVNLEAFETDAEANLVDALRSSDAKLISLVAENEGEIVGHILFSPVTAADQKHVKIAGLAPMAVLPKWQNRGVGSKLVTKGLSECKKAGYDAVIVLGHADYYPRFGFKPAADFSIKSEYEVPSEVFMIKELKSGVLEQLNGLVRYHPLFNSI